MLRTEGTNHPFQCFEVFCEMKMLEIKFNFIKGGKRNSPVQDEITEVTFGAVDQLRPFT